MALVVEDGTGTDLTANSYASVADLRDFVTVRGGTLPVADGDCEVLLLKAMDHLELQPYKGFKFKQFQPLLWPRYDVIVEGWPLLFNEIPRQLIYAQCALANEYQTTELLPTFEPNEHGSVMSEGVSGAVSIGYANNGRVLKVAAVEKASRFINQLIRNNGLFAIRS
jgi:hypothetical protein